MSRKPLPRKLHEEQEEYKANVPQYSCMVCEKKTEGYYGQHQDGGTCSKTCENKQAALPKYGEHTEEAFLKKFNLE